MSTSLLFQKSSWETLLNKCASFFDYAAVGIIVIIGIISVVQRSFIFLNGIYSTSPQTLSASWMAAGVAYVIGSASSKDLGYRRIFVGIIASLSGLNWFEVAFMIGLRQHFVLGYIVNLIPGLTIFAFTNRMRVNRLFLADLILSIVFFASWWLTGVDHRIILPFSGLFGEGAALPLTSVTLAPYIWNSITKAAFTLLPSLLLVKNFRSRTRKSS